MFQDTDDNNVERHSSQNFISLETWERHKSQEMRENLSGKYLVLGGMK
jgi:hypothetical protein